MVDDIPAGFSPFYNSAGGVEYLWRTRPEGGFDIAARQDVDAILDMNKAMATENDGYTPSKDLKRVASIPMIFWSKWMHEEGWDMFDPNSADRLMRKLNSNEFAFLRTAPGHLGPDGNGGFR